ncbi:Clavaminate synthase-like protein [Hymenopellis radicata]|nr:Clavaminate synthase-like protein [Hymenopellis radicata]
MIVPFLPFPTAFTRLSRHAAAARTISTYPTHSGTHSANNTRRHYSFSVSKRDLHIPELKESFPFIWLRDACRCPRCVHPSTRQKLFRTSDIPSEVRPVEVNALTGDELTIKWSTGHESVYDWGFLREHSLSVSRRHGRGSSITQVPNLFVDYRDLNTEEGLRKAIDQTCLYGLLFVRNVPTEKTSAATCSLRHLAKYFSEIRVTFYGDLWDVKNVANSRNIAYTNLDLGLHMDLLYFQHPPQLQILHCLRNRVSGGSSIFSDALHAAETLRNQDPIAFKILCSTQVPFHYINDGHHLYHTHPTIEVSSKGEVKQINYSPPFQAPLLLDTLPEFYGALKKFTELVNNEEHAYEYTMKEGDAVMFDNRRVLHARRAFQDIQGQEVREGDANRWLKGCYIEADALWDKGRILRSALGRTS